MSPQHQKQGVGSQLVRRGIDVLTKEGGDVLLVDGDPTYYQRFGFSEKNQTRIHYAIRAGMPVWLDRNDVEQNSPA